MCDHPVVGCIVRMDVGRPSPGHLGSVCRGDELVHVERLQHVLQILAARGYAIRRVDRHRSVPGVLACRQCRRGKRTAATGVEVKVDRHSPGNSQTLNRSLYDIPRWQCAGGNVRPDDEEGVITPSGSIQAENPTIIGMTSDTPSIANIRFRLAMLRTERSSKLFAPFAMIQRSVEA